MELNENLHRRREEIRGKLEALDSPATDTSSLGGDLESRQQELESLNQSIEDLEGKISGKYPAQMNRFMPSHAYSYPDIEAEHQSLTAKVQDVTEKLESVQALQAEDSRGISKHQKSTERYLAKRALLTTRKDECNKNIRDLGVLPEEAFEKYTNVKLERVRLLL
jgi:structural maintenance of chromosome 3 (chondroitin sulfate proteoglycan 6)